MSRVMDRLRQVWIDEDFEPTEEQLREHVPTVMEELGVTPAPAAAAGKGAGAEKKARKEVNGQGERGGGEGER